MTLRLGYKPPTSYTNFILLGFLIGAGIFMLWQFHVEPAHTFLNPYMTQIITGITLFIAPFTGVFEQLRIGFMANPIPYVTAGISLLVAGYGLISKIRSMRLEQQAQAAVANQAINYENQLHQQAQDLKEHETHVTELEDKISDYEQNNPIDLLKQYEDAITQKNNEITKLHGAVEALGRELEKQKLKVHETTVIK